MIERFLKQTKFTSEQDFKEHLEFIIPEDFNFAYDVMDEWAKIKPDHVALLWASERGEEIRFTYTPFAAVAVREVRAAGRVCRVPDNPVRFPDIRAGRK